MASRCVNYRHGSGEVYRWEFDKDDQSLVVAVNGPLITNDIGLLTRAAIDGIGLAFMSDVQAPPHLASGALVLDCYVRSESSRSVSSDCF
jgi:hypothetical protein